MEIGIKKLPILKVRLNDFNEGLECIAIVDEPAIERTWQTFNKEKVLLKITNPEKRIVMGALLVADMPIYRRDKHGEYYIVFDKPTIEQIVQKFFKEKNSNNVNMMHDGILMDGVVMFESMIIDKERGIETPKGFEPLPDGSWFGSYKVENEKVWQDIKEGKFSGFSIEGYFGYEFEEDLQEKILQKIIHKLINRKQILSIFQPFYIYC